MGSTLREIQQFSREIRSVINGHWLRLLTPTLEPAGGQLGCMMSGHGARIRRLAVTPDGRQIISGDDWGCLKVWDLASGSQMRAVLAHDVSIYALAVTPDGRQVISGDLSGCFKVWDLDTGTELRTVAAHVDPILALAVTPDGHQVISGSGDHTIKLRT